MSKTMMRDGILCRLNEDGLWAQRDYEDHGGCCCHVTTPPCSSCMHEGHPLTIDENNEFWEPVPVKRKGINLFDFLERFKP